MTVDGALAALVCGWALYWGERAAPKVVGYALLLALPLARETGVLLNLASGAVLALARKGRGLALWAWQSCPVPAGTRSWQPGRRGGRGIWDSS